MWRFWIFLLLAWPAAAETIGPLELPPDDFSGAQYIDSAGCVYLRQGSVWAPRLDRDGSVICGYPPSLPGQSVPTDGGRDAALRLSVTLAQGLQNSDLRENPADPLHRTPVEPQRPSSGQLSDLNSALNAVRAMRTVSAARPDGSEALCGLLGYDEAGQGAGTNQTLGFCGGGTPDLQPKSAMTSSGQGDAPGEAADHGSDVAADHGSDVAADHATGAASAAGRQKPQATGTKPATRAAAAAPGRAETRARSGAAKAAPTGAGAARGTGASADPVPPDLIPPDLILPDLIPADARYVQLGRYADAAEAEAAILRLVGAGYPVARGRKPDADMGGRLILVGPFHDRQALATALSRLRQSGYPKAFAR